MGLPRRRLTILQVEDSPSDAALTAYALKMNGVPHSIHVVTDGRQAMQFLHRSGGHEHAPRPDLILLDLSLPGDDGHEVLRKIKNDSDLKAIPVIIFSTFDASAAQRVAYELHASSYVVKPNQLSTFVAAVQAIESYWSRTTALPDPTPAK
jgi:CheY-like chemotaxis protein